MRQEGLAMLLKEHPFAVIHSNGASSTELVVKLHLGMFTHIIVLLDKHFDRVLVESIRAIN